MKLLRLIVLVCVIALAIPLAAVSSAEPTVEVRTAPYDRGEGCANTAYIDPRDGTPIKTRSAVVGCAYAPPQAPPSPDPGWLAIPAQNGMLTFGGWATFSSSILSGRGEGVYMTAATLFYTPPATGPLSIQADIDGFLYTIGLGNIVRASLCMTVTQVNTSTSTTSTIGSDCFRRQDPLEGGATVIALRDLAVSSTLTHTGPITVRIQLEGLHDVGAGQALVNSVTFSSGS